MPITVGQSRVARKSVRRVTLEEREALGIVISSGDAEPAAPRIVAFVWGPAPLAPAPLAPAPLTPDVMGAPLWGAIPAG